MIDFERIADEFARLKVCVIIPTYNNASTLTGVINDVAAYTRNIIVANDGSTDGTADLLKTIPFIQVVGYPDNMGKGWAMRKAFAFALLRGYHYAITIDSDGQHFATDLPAFIYKLQQVRDAVIIGSRNMGQASVPGKSSFGHKFSNFWFKVETGISCPDTQSGYRLYPLYLLKDINFFTRKYEFEIEVLVRAAWRGIGITAISVSVYYAPKETRISHFRPFKDFTRISILNIFLVIMAFAWIKPRDFFRALFDKKKSRQLIYDQLLNLGQPDPLKAASVGFGVFMGIVPLWGFQMLAALFLAVLLRLNKALVIIASNISIPPMIPFIIYLSYKTGGFWMGGKGAAIAFSRSISLKSISLHLEQYIYGSITLAAAAGLLAGIATFILLRIFKRKTAGRLAPV